MNPGCLYDEEGTSYELGDENFYPYNHYDIEGDSGEDDW